MVVLLVANHCFTSSSPPSIPRCPIAASSSWIFLSISRTEHVLKYCSICEVHEFSFPTSPHSPKIDSEQESCVHFIPALQSVPNFRTRSIQSFCHISLYGSSNSLILDALEREFHGAYEYQLFIPCTSLSMCKIWWKQRGLLSNFWRCWQIWFLLWSWILGTLCHACKTIQVHNLPPRWRSGVETNVNKPTIPKISNCGIASLAKKKPSECTCVLV